MNDGIYMDQTTNHLHCDPTPSCLPSQTGYWHEAPKETRFTRAVLQILIHEAEYRHDPFDREGAAKYGVSLRYLHQLGVDLGEIDMGEDAAICPNLPQIPRQQAIGLYRQYWWDAYDYGSLPEEAGEKIFDLAINMGSLQSHRIAQRACRACGEEMVEDGILGSQTRACLDDIYAPLLLPSLRSEAAGYYRTLAALRPHLHQFLPGWVRRAYA